MLAGALLLKTQFAPWVADYGYLPIRPRAGDLWLFPGYVPHAVMPRALSQAQPAAPAAQPTLASTVAADDEVRGPRLRVSVACNILHDQGGAEAVDAKRIMRRLMSC